MNRRSFLKLAAISPLAGLAAKNIQPDPAVISNGNESVRRWQAGTSYIEPIRQKILEMKNPAKVFLGKEYHALVVRECEGHFLSLRKKPFCGPKRPDGWVKELRILGVPVELSSYLAPMSGVVCESTLLPDIWVHTTHFMADESSLTSVDMRRHINYGVYTTA